MRQENRDFVERDFTTAVAQMRQAGMEVEVADTYVRLLENGVHAGTPCDMGDADYETTLLPALWAQNDATAMVRVRGDSMIEAGIDDGDYVMVRHEQTCADGDVVMVMLDGECTLKSFFRDSDGHAWLVPCNPDFSVIDPEEFTKVTVLGKVIRVVKAVPRTSYGYLANRVKQWKAEQSQAGPTPPLETEEAQEVWAALHKAGIVDATYQADAKWKNAVIADEMGDYLKLRKKWEAFCDFWGLKNLRSSMTNKKNDKALRIFRKHVRGVIHYKQ